jgi:UDP-2,4-diacetamido-2,4,6-trideoxy-beta-L-altropyranose hydrolase
VNTKHSILFRCDGSHEVGFGHIIRCLALADELKDNHGCDIIFAILRDNKAIELIESHGYQVTAADPNEEDFCYEEWLNNIVKQNNPNSIILDVRDDLPSETISNFHKQGILIVTIDDPTDRRLLADLAFYPPVPQVERMDWKGFTGQLYVGWEWVVLRREFSQTYRNSSTRRNETCASKIRNILVTMGGSDPQGMTLKAVKAMALLNDHFEATIILGPGFTHRKKLDELLKGFSHQYKIYESLSNMSDIMAEADLAVASFGVTAYELAAMGVPAIYLCLTEDHEQSALMFQDSGLGLSLGLADFATDDELIASVRYFMNNENIRLKTANHLKNNIDGRGATRIAQLVTSVVSKGGYRNESQVD